MAQDTQYAPVPFVYKSRGAISRFITDQAPEHTYLELLNGQEREENSMSSRYGTSIINRDPAGTGFNNYFFSSPVTSLARLAFQNDAWRYAGLGDGSLWRRAGNAQGAYTQIATGLSGQPFDTITTNCYETSQNFLFVYDQAASLKDNGLLAAPQLTGIDAPLVPPCVAPFSPLLTLINNFAEGNSYTAEGFSSGWAYSSVGDIPGTQGQIVTDFPQFVATDAPESIAGGSAAVTQVGTGETVHLAFFSGFGSEVLTPGDVVTLSMPVSGSFNATVTGLVPVGRPWGSATIDYAYSINSGATWTSFFSYMAIVGRMNQRENFPPSTASVAISGLPNLDALFVKITVTAQVTTANVTLDVGGLAGTIEASVNTAGIFGPVCNGILSVLNTNSTVMPPIASVGSADPSSGVYQTLLVTTTSAHGLSLGDFISIYGSSNDVVDGFYQVWGVISSTQFKVLFTSASYISATGGSVMGGEAAPSVCVLVNEYAIPYPTQFSAWGFYQQVPLATTAFPIGQWSGSVATDTTATVGVTAGFDLSINNQVTDDDLIVLVMKVGSPENISNIRLQFDVNSSGYTSTYYYKDITPSYYQGNIANQISAYNATEQQILADTLGVLSGTPPNSTTSQLRPGNLSTGGGAWTAIYLRRGDFLPVGNAGQSGLDWTVITGWQLVIDTTATAISGSGSSTVACNGLYLQWGYGPSSFAGVGYDYRYTYYDANTGTESSPSPEQYFNEQFGYLPTLAAPFFLRQAAQVLGSYSTDPQVTHIRIYRRGGIYADNWRLLDTVLNAGSAFPNFVYKDVIPDASLAQSSTLVLDNDAPVTSSLVNPVNTTLAAPTVNFYGSTPYQTYNPIFLVQTVTAADATSEFVLGQIVDVGIVSNLEQVTVVTGGTGQFSAVFQLQHNAGEPVVAYAVPRAKCDLCAVSNSGGVTQVWLAGDPNNPHYLYRSKPGQPENFSPADYLPVGSPDYPINAVINWRGAIWVGTTATWWIVVGGANPYPQPTGCPYGVTAKHGWAEVEGAIHYQALDGIRELTGAEAPLKSNGIEWVFRDQPLSLIPLADLTQLSQSITEYYQNQVYTSYVSQDDGQRYRLVFDRTYDRWRYDDIAATAMLWEKDTNLLLVGKEVSPGNYAVVQDQVYTQDYDDGGWSGTTLLKTPINFLIQHPYRDLGKPHFPKQWNMLETDVNTNGTVMDTTLLFDDGDTVPNITLATANTGTNRKKVQFVITGNGGTDTDVADGQQAYRMSIRHSIQVTVAPILYQEDVYAAQLADYNNSLDTYWIKFGTDRSKLVKQGYFDYTCAVPINVNLYADGSPIAYYSFQLPAQLLPTYGPRQVVRVRFGNKNNGTTAFTVRTWRMIMLSSDVAQSFQMWVAPSIEWKEIQAGHSYQVKELTT